MTELVSLAKELGIKTEIIKMLQLSQVNLLFVPCPFKSVKQNIHSATMYKMHKSVFIGYNIGCKHSLHLEKGLEIIF